MIEASENVYWGVLSLIATYGRKRTKEGLVYDVVCQENPQEASRLPWPFRIVPNWVCGGGELSHTCVNQSLDEGYPGQET